MARIKGPWLAGWLAGGQLAGWLAGWLQARPVTWHRPEGRQSGALGPHTQASVLQLLVGRHTGCSG